MSLQTPGNGQPGYLEDPTVPESSLLVANATKIITLLLLHVSSNPR
jgi:hypothetical protein